MYFWEANPRRGLHFAREAAKRTGSAIKKPAVVGAVIDLGLCLDMSTQGAIERVTLAYESLKKTLEVAGAPLPENSESLLLRRLDCAVMTRLHTILDDDGILLDTVRGVFLEGEPIYPKSGFRAKTHTQIAVRNLDCIKGVFRVPKSQLIGQAG